MCSDAEIGVLRDIGQLAVARHIGNTTKSHVLGLYRQYTKDSTKTVVVVVVVIVLVVIVIVVVVVVDIVE